eukprot:GHVR01059760.1.p2 GENE.GHVR01059760.1~~GHVR01059760.1.p2  ORF type:complete len:248 (+),score=68.19 GHVR01059760.1:2-745(+)
MKSMIQISAIKGLKLPTECFLPEINNEDGRQINNHTHNHTHTQILSVVEEINSPTHQQTPKEPMHPIIEEDPPAYPPPPDTIMQNQINTSPVSILNAEAEEFVPQETNNEQDTPTQKIKKPRAAPTKTTITAPLGTKSWIRPNKLFIALEESVELLVHRFKAPQEKAPKVLTDFIHTLYNIRPAEIDITLSEVKEDTNNPDSPVREVVEPQGSPDRDETHSNIICATTHPTGKDQPEEATHVLWLQE